MTTESEPEGLGLGGSTLWQAIIDEHDLDAAQVVQLEEACRAKDRLDRLDQLLRGEVATWTSLVLDITSDGTTYDLRVSAALTQANATANMMKQLLAALRLPDAQSGKRPQHRGARGAYKPVAAKGVSSLERARQAKTG